MAAIPQLCSSLSAQVLSSRKSSSFLSFASPSSTNQPRRPRRTAGISRTRPVSCSGGDGGDASSGANDSIDRRHVLLGLGGLYGATNGLVLPGQAFGTPIKAPEISDCHSATVNGEVLEESCCPPNSKIVDYVPKRPTRMRVRRPAHNFTKDDIAKYEEATRLMKELPMDDPRNFMQQANIHCAYCSDAYDQVGFPELPLQIHECWLFFPFHRWYLYFYEKILGKLIGDEDFTLPFWNYDAPAGMQMPSYFDNESSPLYDPIRDPTNRPPKLVDLTWPLDQQLENPTDEEIIANNLSVMYRQMISNSKKPRLFFGEKYVSGSDPSPGQGSVEATPHSPVHAFVGDPNQPNFENMGNFYSAARDPLFYCHHSNVDRLWEVWKTLSPRNRDPVRFDEFSNANFLFYDENKQLVRVKVRDCVDPSLLGYRYENVDIPWLKDECKPRPSMPRKSPKERKALRNPRFPVELTSPVSTLVKRPKKSRSKKEKEDVEEVLVVKGIDIDRTKFTKFDVYVNSPDNVVKSGSAEFAGSFVNVPRKASGRKAFKSNVKLGLTDLLDDINADDDDDIIVTLVPRNGKVKVDGVAIEFLTEDF